MERRLSAVVLVQQSLLADARTCARTGITLDITEHEFRVMSGDTCKVSNSLFTIHTCYIKYYSSPNFHSNRKNVDHIVNALKIPNKGKDTIALMATFYSIPLIRVDSDGCYVKYMDSCCLDLDLNEATRAFVKLKELGYN
jgi:hypothetical protein